MAGNSTKIIKQRNVFLNMLWACLAPIHKNNQKMILQTIGQYLSQLILARSLKNFYTKDYLIF